MTHVCQLAEDAATRLPDALLQEIFEPNVDIQETG